MSVRRVSGLTIMPPSYSALRLTIPVREALERAGNRVEQDTIPPSVIGPRYTVTLSGAVPPGIVECVIGRGSEQHRGLRCADEPEYPGEWPPDVVAWYEHGQWVPCPAPRCARALVWYEAGYVPGYRVCTAGHHATLSGDGRSATPVRA